MSELLEGMARFKAKYPFAPEPEITPKHCQIKDCACKHIECDKGWVEHIVDEQVVVDACYQCRPKLNWGLKEYKDSSELRQDSLKRRANKLSDKSIDTRTVI